MAACRNEIFCRSYSRSRKQLFQITNSLFILCSVLILIRSPVAIAGDPEQRPTCSNVKGNVVIAYKKIGMPWEGWGTALAWWANWAGGLQKKGDFQFLMNLLFKADEGLGLNVVRYNIGGGGYSPHSHPQFVGFLKYRRMPGFKWTAKSPLDPNADRNQRKVLLAARDRGANVFEAFSNSPPAYMTNSKSFTGSFQSHQDNLRPDMYRSFANYLVLVTKYYKTNHNIEFRTLEPMNEPTEGQWVYGGKQEGCNFQFSSIVKIIQITSHVLKKDTLKTSLAAPDSIGKNGIDIVKSMTKSTLRRISQINVHSYETGPIRKSFSRQIQWRQNLASNAAKLRKKVVVSEWGPYGMKSTPYEYGLTLAKQVMMDVNVLKAASWTYWQAVEHSQKARRWGLIFVRMDRQDTLQYEIGSQYYALMQFAKWIRPGAEILQVDSSCVHGLVAAYDRSKKRLIVVAANYMKSDYYLTFNVQFKTVGGNTPMFAYRTSATEKHVAIGTWNHNLPSRVPIGMTARSITTFVFPNVQP